MEAKFLALPANGASLTRAARDCYEIASMSIISAVRVSTITAISFYLTAIEHAVDAILVHDGVDYARVSSLGSKIGLSTTLTPEEKEATLSLTQYIVSTPDSILCTSFNTFGMQQVYQIARVAYMVTTRACYLWGNGMLMRPPVDVFSGVKL